MLKKGLSIIQYIFFLGLGIGLLWYSASNMTDEQFKQLKESFGQTRFIYLLPVAFTLLIAHLSRGIRWKILMAPMGYKPATMNVFFAVMIGYFFNLLVPRLGELMKCTTLSKYEKIPPDKLIGTIVAERAFDVVCLLLVIVLSALIQFDVIGHYTINLFSGLLNGKGGSFSFIKLFVFIITVAVLIISLRWLFKHYSHKGLLYRVKHFFFGIWEGLTSLRRVQKKGWFFFHTALVWSMYLASIYIGFYAFPAIEHLGVNGSLAVLTFGSLGMVIPTPGGVGSYQYAIKKTLPLYGVSEITSFAFGNVLWGAQTIILIVFGVLSLVFLPVFNKKK